MAVHEKDQYDAIAALYDSIESLPMAAMYNPLIIHALGDSHGKTVLDLGGGTGTHARNALAQGARRVDVVDISPAMLEVGKRIEQRAGRADRIRWYVGDIAQPLAHLPLDAQYDVVMVNWTFDHAATPAELEAMWANTAAYTAPGGRVISIRVSAVATEAARIGKYGVVFSDVEPIPGGFKYVYTGQTEPPMACPATTLSASMDFAQAQAMAARHGFVDFRRVPEQATDVYRRDPAFWQMHMDNPYFMVIEATKSA